MFLACYAYGGLFLVQVYIVVTQCTAVHLQPGSKCTDTGDVHENAVTVIRDMFVFKIFL